MTATSVVVVTVKFLFGVCDCTVDIDTGMGNFSPMLGILQCVDMCMCDHISLWVWTAGVKIFWEPSSYFLQFWTHDQTFLNREVYKCGCFSFMSSFHFGRL